MYFNLYSYFHHGHFYWHMLILDLLRFFCKKKSKPFDLSRMKYSIFYGKMICSRMYWIYRINSVNSLFDSDLINKRNRKFVMQLHLLMSMQFFHAGLWVPKKLEGNRLYCIRGWFKPIITKWKQWKYQIIWWRIY